MSLYEYLELDKPWFNPPKNGSNQKDLQMQYVQFRKDVANSYMKDYLDWTYKDFVDSGYVRAKLTERKGCYVKKFVGILDVFKKPDILFSFDYQ